MALLAGLALATASTAQAGNGQMLVRLGHAVTVHAAPSGSSRTVMELSAQMPLTGSPAFLPVIARSRGWLRVQLPARPNSATGWIAATDAALVATPWRIVVHRDSRRADVLENGRVQRAFPVVVGKPSTPTPLGHFFVTERLYLGDGVVEGPWALATSAYSDVLEQFGGGPGQIGLHGDTGFRDPLGSAASHGCVRFANAAIAWIATHVTDGTPLTIEP